VAKKPPIQNRDVAAGAPAGRINQNRARNERDRVGSVNAASTRRPSALIDVWHRFPTGESHCIDNLDQLAKLPDTCIDLIYIDPPFNSNRNYEVFWGETREKRAFEDRHASTQAYIEYMSTDLAASGGRPRCVELARVLKKTGSFYYHCDWHASHSRTRMVT
jgi:16S rRNA G966 N2-methylase RsmD